MLQESIFNLDAMKSGSPFEKQLFDDGLNKDR